MISLVVLGVSFRFMIISDDNDGAFLVMSRWLTISFFTDNVAAFYLSICPHEPINKLRLESLCCSHAAGAKPDAENSLDSCSASTSGHPILFRFTSLLVPETPMKKG